MDIIRKIITIETKHPTLEFLVSLPPEPTIKTADISMLDASKPPAMVVAVYKLVKPVGDYVYQYEFSGMRIK